MTTPRPGMDHALYPFSPIHERSQLTWPGQAHLAATVFLYLEHWALLPRPGTVQDPRFRDHYGEFQPDYRTYTWREYGNRVGIFRLLDVLDRLRLPVTVAANATALARYPYLVEQLLRRDYEFAAHGSDATDMLTSAMSEDEERRFIAASIAAVTRATGVPPQGWIGQDYSESARTPALLAEAGLRYLADWPNDDQPYLMSIPMPIVSLPNQSEWDDVQLLWHRRVLSPRFPGLIEEAVSTLSDDAERAGSGRFFGLHLHPWLSGMPHRAAYAAQALETLARTERIWFATAAEIVRHAAPQLRAAKL